MAKVSKYSILFYSGEQGYQNNRAQVTLGPLPRRGAQQIELGARFTRPRPQRRPGLASAVTQVAELVQHRAVLDKYQQQRQKPGKR